MNEEERNDLLVRLAVGMESIEKRLSNIEGILSSGMCYTHKEKIRALEKITWTVLLASVTALPTAIFAIVKYISGGVPK